MAGLVLLGAVGATCGVVAAGSAFEWTNSPGYRDGVINFDRSIYPRCLECLSSGFQSVADFNVLNRYQSIAVLLGITCVLFFFQAEDGIRDHCVTGVQTCALPI